MPALTQTKYEIISIDVEDVYRAIKKNGFDHLRGYWFAGNGACVMGQAALNLGVEPEGGFLDSFLEGIGFEDDDDGPSEERYQAINDFENYNLITQLNQFEVDEDSKWYEANTNGKVGSTIIDWNDRKAVDPETGRLAFDKENNVYIWALPTYDDVANMAYDILSPHFGKKISLIVHDYAKQSYDGE